MPSLEVAAGGEANRFPLWLASTLDLQELHEEPHLKKEASVRRQAVLDLIKDQSAAITTKEMARILRVKEVSVRAAVTWLGLGGYIVPDGHEVRVYENKSYKKKIALYKWTGKADPICPVRVKEVDELAREQINKRYGDGGLALQEAMSLMVGGKGK
jgi:hypothetical protein